MNLKVISAIAAGLLASAPAFAAPVVLDFEGASSFQSIDGYYGGGTDGGGLSGPNVGVLFGGDALALSNDELGPYFSNAPSPGSILSAVGADAALNYSAGFIGASFFYSASTDTTVGVYSGDNGQGTLLATFTLLANAQTGCNDSAYCNWTLASLNFGGAVARSLQFGSAANVAGFDNVTLAPVPLPAAAWLLLSGLGGLGILRRKQAA